jgi:hypothetical protein
LQHCEEEIFTQFRRTISDADPYPGYGCFFDPWIRDPGRVKKSESGSGMNNPDHIAESLETFFSGLKILKFFDAHPGWKKFVSGMEKIRIREEEKILDPLHWKP